MVSIPLALLRSRRRLSRFKRLASHSRAASALPLPFSRARHPCGTAPAAVRSRRTSPRTMRCRTCLSTLPNGAHRPALSLAAAAARGAPHEPCAFHGASLPMRLRPTCLPACSLAVRPSALNRMGNHEEKASALPASECVSSLPPSSGCFEFLSFRLQHAFQSRALVLACRRAGARPRRPRCCTRRRFPIC
jgi:hypothetical protein